MILLPSELKTPLQAELQDAAIRNYPLESAEFPQTSPIFILNLYVFPIDS